MRKVSVPRRKPGRDYDELSGLICDRLIMALAVAQQFHDRARRSPAGDDRITGSLNTGNVEEGHGLIYDVCLLGDTVEEVEN
jgi:hypothetical protein